MAYAEAPDAAHACCLERKVQQEVACACTQMGPDDLELAREMRLMRGLAKTRETGQEDEEKELVPAPNAPQLPSCGRR
jgi:hypothetical protein